jgi:hypothetical protein
MLNHEIVEVLPEHVEEVASRMAAADRAEVLALAGHSPAQALEHALAASAEAYTGIVDGRAECIFGLAHLTDQFASPWLLATEDLPKAKFCFLRENKRVLDIWQAQHPVLVNYVDERHTVAIRWLRWLGFQIYAPIPLGSGMFCRAERRSHV